MQETGISWTDCSWNPLRGCSRVSPGCQHCYAEELAARFSGPGMAYEGLARRRRNGEAQWTGEVRFMEHKLEEPLHWRQPRRIFVNSMSDLFHESVPFDVIDRIFAVMALARQHTFQVLTKRSLRMRDYCCTLGQHHEVDRVSLAAKGLGGSFSWVLGKTTQRWGWHLPNVHVGVSVENQACADERVPDLLATPAAVRWLSVEPLLGPVDLTPFPPFLAHLGAVPVECEHGFDACPRCDRGVDWVVIGGESGRGHRPMDVAWLDKIVQQCRYCHVPVWVKQDSGLRPGKQGRIPDRLWWQQLPEPHPSTSR